MRIPQLLVVASSLVAAAAAQSRGAQWPYSMDFGPALMTTVVDRGPAGSVDKCLVVRVGDQGSVAFDTELLRVSSVWTDGWLRLRGTAYDESHGPMPERAGKLVCETLPTPGWAKDNSFVDPRPIPHGPLPREWGQYLGHARVGDDVVVEYRIGDMVVRERYAFAAKPVAGLVRTLELSPSKQTQDLAVLDGPAASGSAVTEIDGRQVAVLQWTPSAPGMVETEATAGDYDALVLGAPSRADYLDASSGTGATIHYVPGFVDARDGTAAADRSLPRLNDGQGAANDDDLDRNVWFERGRGQGRNAHGRILVDLQKAVDVSRVQTYSWHRAERSPQGYVLYGSADANADAAAGDLAAAGWQRIAEVDTEALGQGGKHVAAVAKAEGLGKYRRLLFEVRRLGTFLDEIDVWAGDHKAPIDQSPRQRHNLVAELRGDGAQLWEKEQRLGLRVPAHDKTITLELFVAACGDDSLGKLLAPGQAAAEVTAIPNGAGITRWNETVVTEGVRGNDDGAFAVDTITIPFENPYGSRMRTGAFDFFRDGRAAVSTWNGDVWVVSGIDEDLDRLEWKRFATGLYDPLGLRIVDDVVYTHGRDGITRLLDTDGDGEADRYECLNNMVYITPAFHEFAFDLQTDPEGNFYFSKGAPVNPGGRGFMTIVPHHGTILKVAKDGSTIEAIATGLRAPNGICVSPDGKVITSGDNEGTFMPRCRINWIEKPGFYAGVKDTAHRTPVPDQPDLPLCWMPMEIDNSSGNQVWVTGAGWPDLQGRLLHNSYGTCSTYLVLPERVNGQMQGGIVRLPASFSSSCMRGRFSPIDGQLYTIGLKGWQTSAAKEGGFHRVRRTKAPLDLPIALRTCDKGVYLTFSEALDEQTANDPESFGVEIWNYRYSPNYGSPEVSVLEPERQVPQGKQNRDPLQVTAAKLSPDKRTVFLAIDGMQPVHQMKLTWDLDTQDGRALRGELHNSIHALAADPGFPKEGR